MGWRGNKKQKERTEKGWISLDPWMEGMETGSFILPNFCLGVNCNKPISFMTNLCECVSWDQGLPWKPVQMAKDNWEMPGWEELLQVVKFGP